MSSKRSAPAACRGSNSTDPLVHVAIAVRDVEPWIGEAIDSLLAQTFDRWIATIVDDGSSDATAALIEGRDPRIRLIRPGRVGLVEAINRAVRDADTPLVARFDGDDVCHPERFAEQVGFLDANPDVDVVDSRVTCFRDDAPLPGGMARFERWLDSIHTDDDFDREFLVDSPVCNPAAMVRRSALLDCRPGDFPEDYDVWLRMRRAGARFHKLPRRLLKWRDRSDRVTRTDPRYRRDAFFRTKLEHFGATNTAERVAVWGAKKHGKPWIRALGPVAVVDIDPAVTERQGIPVIRPAQLPAARPDLVLVAVGSPGARVIIEAQLAEMGLPALAVAGLATIPASPNDNHVS